MRTESDIADLVEHLWTIVEGADLGGKALRAMAMFILDAQEAERDAILAYFMEHGTLTRDQCEEEILQGAHHV